MRSLLYGSIAGALCLIATPQGPLFVVWSQRNTSAIALWQGLGEVSYYISPVNFVFDGHEAGSLTLPAPEVNALVQSAFEAWAAAVAPGVLPPLVPRLATRSGRPLSYDTPEAFERQLRVPARPRERAVYVVYDPANASNEGVPTGARPTTSHIFAADLSGFACVFVMLPRSSRIGTLEDFKRVILHEVGHALGLAHAFVFTRGEMAGGAFAAHPMAMFPYLSSGVALSPAPGDLASLEYLYSSDAKLSPTVAAIEGTLYDSAGEPVNGVSVVAESAVDGEKTNGMFLPARYSALSGYTGRAGQYLLAVRPGRYRLFAVAIEGRLSMQGYQPITLRQVLGPQILRNNSWERVPQHGEVEQQWLVETPPIQVSGGSRITRDLKLR